MGTRTAQGLLGKISVKMENYRSSAFFNAKGLSTETKMSQEGRDLWESWNAKVEGLDARGKSGTTDLQDCQLSS